MKAGERPSTSLKGDAQHIGEAGVSRNKKIEMENLLESLLLLVVGMTGVFISLIFLAGMIWVFRYADEWLNKRRITNYSAKVEAKQVDDDVNDELVAVISAAATAAMRKAVTVRKIQFLGQQTGAAWAVTGRLNVMASHAISKRKSSS